MLTTMIIHPWLLHPTSHDNLINYSKPSIRFHGITRLNLRCIATGSESPSGSPSDQGQM
jgi:hypothetical protein